MPGPAFEGAFIEQLEQLIAWRRDVRRFRTEPVPERLLARVLDMASRSPSVGNSQPWRFVRVDDRERRATIRRSFERCNGDALAAEPEHRAPSYARLKLEGLDRAPVQFAVCCETDPVEGHGLGRRTMPETLAYSVVTAVHTFWLVARAHSLGVGWVSILDPDVVLRALDVPGSWRLVAYLCVGWPAEEHLDPELVRYGWQERTAVGRAVVQR